MAAPATPREDANGLATILQDVRVLARRGSFCVASRRFGDLRLEDGRHQLLERASLESLESLEHALGHEDLAALRRLAESRARLLQLEDSCAAALQRCSCAEYEDAASALEQELKTHAELERLLTRRLHGLLGGKARGGAGDPEE